MLSYVTWKPNAILNWIKFKHIESQLKDDDLKGWDDIVIRIKQHLTPESVLVPACHSFVDCAVDWLYFCTGHQY